MFFALYAAGFVALMIVNVFLWIAFRTAVSQLRDNSARQRREAAVTRMWWTTSDPSTPDVHGPAYGPFTPPVAGLQLDDEPVQMWPTYTDVRAVDDTADPESTDLRRRCY